MSEKTATPPTIEVNEDGAQRLENAIAALSFEPYPAWMDTDEVGEDGRLVAMPPDERCQDYVIAEQERLQWAREAEKAGDHARAAFEHRQAEAERQHAAGFVEAVVRSNGTPAPRRAESSGRPAVRGSSRRSSARSGDSGADDDGLADPPPPDGPAERRPANCPRPCKQDGCGNDISHLASQAKFCDDRRCVLERERQRKQAEREHEREELELEVERQAGRDFEAGLPGRPQLCQCKPPREFEQGHCDKCGHDLEHLAVARAHDSGPLKSRLIVVHARHRPRKPTRYGDRKRKPVTHAKLLPSGEVVPA